MRARVLAVVLLILSAAPAIAQEQAGYRYTSSFFPLGVRDSEGKSAYVAGPKDRNLAVRLSDGKTLWSVPGAGRPVGLAHDRLLVQVPLLAPVYDDVRAPRNRIRIDMLDVGHKGEETAYSQPITFPDWVRVGHEHGSTFASWGWLDREQFYLAWEATAFFAGGPPPPPEIAKAANKHAAGVARVNLQTGQVTMLKADAASPPQRTLPAPLRQQPLSRLYSEVASAMVDKRLVVGDVLAVLDCQMNQKRQRLVLKRWDIASGAALPASTLMEREALTAQLTHDGAHLLVHPTTATNVAPADHDVYRVFSLRTGDKVGQFQSEGGTLYTVIGTRVYVLVTHPSTDAALARRTVRAIDLTTGQTVWELPVRPRVDLPPRP
jgi:hypothetical protein